MRLRFPNRTSHRCPRYPLHQPSLDSGGSNPAIERSVDGLANPAPTPTVTPTATPVVHQLYVPYILK